MIGFGSPEGAIIIEDVIDKIAFSLSIDPAKVREINLSREGDYPHYGTKAVNEDFLIRCWNECLEQSDYWNVKKEVDLIRLTSTGKEELQLLQQSLSP